MIEDDIRSTPPSVITNEQREFYFSNGFLHLPEFLGSDALAPLLGATADLLATARATTESNCVFDLGPTHCRDVPDVRRIRAAVDQHPRYWEVASQSKIVDLVADLVGPDVKFHSAKLNFKRAHNGVSGAIRWHQDIQAWPHTNYSPVTIGLYLEDVTEAHGPLQVVPGSHSGPLFDQFPNGQWTGFIADEDLPAAHPEQAVSLTGKAGTVFAINCRTVHASPPNMADGLRPCLLNVYSAADAFTYTAAPTPTTRTGTIVRGHRARWAHHDPRPCRLPPDWAAIGYGSIYSAQAGEAQTAPGAS